MNPFQELWLGKVDRAGKGVRLSGKPHFENKGRLLLGDRVYIASRPVQSHLISARRGVIEIGDDVHIGQGAAINSQASITIGEGTRLGDFVVIADSDYHVPGDRHAEPPVTPVVIGKRVTIGARATILRGTSIGDGAWVAAGAVVSGTVNPGEKVAGVPARPLSTHGQAASDDTALELPLVVQRALHLGAPPRLEAGRDQLPAWDSLGTLTLLLALEDAFAVSLREEEMVRARTLQDLVTAVEAARERLG